jgi:hypothetical protein
VVPSQLPSLVNAIGIVTTAEYKPPKTEAVIVPGTHANGVDVGSSRD